MLRRCAVTTRLTYLLLLLRGSEYCSLDCSRQRVLSVQLRRKKQGGGLVPARGKMRVNRLSEEAATRDAHRNEEVSTHATEN